MRFLLTAFLLAVTLFSPPVAQAQSSPPPLLWQDRTTAVGSPGQIEGAAMAFDEQQGVMLLFGGSVSTGGFGALVSNNLWQYNGTAWQQVAVIGTLPAPRSEHALIYDPVDHRVLLFGGDAGGGTYLNDLWAFVFSGPGVGAWTRLSDLPSAGRQSMAMGYDANRDRFVVVGGFKQGTEPEFTPSGAFQVIPATRETFEWNRASWSAGPPSALYNNGPYANEQIHFVQAGPFGGTLGFHPSSGELMLIAERFLAIYDLPYANLGQMGGVTLYNGSSWSSNYGGYHTFINGTFSELVTTTRFQSAYDPSRGRLIVANGDRNVSNEYNGTEWIRLGGNFGGLPTRPRFCLGHDTVRGVTVFFGGKASLTDPGDTFELVENPAVPFAITTDLVPTVLEPCQGEALTLTSAASGVAPITVRWFREGSLLPGETSLTLSRPILTLSDSGIYTFKVTDPTGRSHTSQATQVIVHGPPVFTQNPTPRRVVPGETFSVEAAWTSTLPITSIQWYRGGDLIPGATDAVYTKANAIVADGGIYTVRLTTRCTTVFSPGGRVLVGPHVNQHPVAPGGQAVGFSPVTMSVTADGVGAEVGTYTTGGQATTYPHHHAPDSPTHPRPLLFTWRHEGVPIFPGAKYTISSSPLASEIVINNPDYEDEGYYDCVVTDVCGFTYSRTSGQTLLILTPLAPPYLTLPGATPEQRTGAGMVFDSARGRTVLFGGLAYGDNPRDNYNFKVGFASNDTWEWDGRLWVKRNPAHRPPAMTNFAIAYDQARGRTVIFGGYEYQHPDYALGSQVVSNVVWEWDGNDWSQPAAPTASFPPARVQASMCYDATRQEILLIGGHQFSPNPPNSRAAINALWAWNGAQWSPRANLPTPSDNPTPEVYPGNAFTFDSLRGVAVLFGPFFDPENPVWEWNGTVWNRIVSPVELRLQESRGYSGSPFFDTVRRMVALPTISNNIAYAPGSISTLLYWNGSSFLRGDSSVIDEVSGAVLTDISAVPAVVQEDLTAFDSARRCLVWLDRDLSTFTPFTTREMHFSAKVKPVYFPPQVIFAPNQTISLHVISAGQRGLVYQWLKNGEPILDDARRSGADTATLTLAPANASDLGQYTVRITNLYNQVTTQAASVGLLSNGLAIASQGTGLTLSWTGTTGVLETATDLAGPWTPVPGATSPFSAALDGPARFYRVAFPE